MNQKACPSQKGQSLLEIVVALSAAMLVLMALVKVTIGSLNSGNFAKNEAQATQYARQSLEEARVLKETNPTTFFVFGDSTCPANVGIDGFTIVRDCELAGDDTMTVVATASWVEGSQTHQSRLETKLTRR